MKNNISNHLIPNVTKLPKQKGEVANSNKLNEGTNSDFKNLLENKIDRVSKEHGLKLSKHAAKRIEERNLELEGGEYLKIKEAIGQLKDKGGRDSLVVTSRGAYIVDVPENKIVTAMDKTKLNENVFTKIDSTLFID